MAKQGSDQFQKRHRKAWSIGIGIGATVLSTVAFAAWDISGDGNSSGKAATAQKITIAVDPNPDADLWPGNQGAAQYTIKNPNVFPVNVTALKFGTITSDKKTAANADCATFLVPVNQTVVFAQPLNVPANTTLQAQKLPHAFTLDINTPSECQGTTFTVLTTATATSG